MKKTLIVSILLFLSCSKPKNNFTDLNGNAVFLKEYQGKKVLLCFWAAWCRTCLKEIKLLQENKEKLERNNCKVLLASNESIETITQFQKEHHIDFKFIRYRGNLADLEIHTLPTTIMYNEQNKQVQKIVGMLNLDSL
ncbi:TlpA family protein disulfide reductase [Tenacibaculum maritimum]|uniref:TlpA family protein disulfide reductase n=1 Tax=Tenacibaculum maritimum TaxID=107401 RepID=UPI003875D7D1